MQRDAAAAREQARQGTPAASGGEAPEGEAVKTERAGVACFWIERTDRVEVRLRRFVHSSEAKCPGPYGYHNADVVIYPDVPSAEWLKPRADGVIENLRTLEDMRADPRWPAKCDGCGYGFTSDDEYQINPEPLYAGAPDGRLYTTENAPPGAMWDAKWNPDAWRGADGISLMVKIPSGVACDVDVGEWKRTGDPRRPETLTVKPSIRHGDQWHGYLTDGVLHL